MAIEKPTWWEVKYTTANDGYKNNGPISGPKGIVIHSPGPGGINTVEKMFANFNVSGRGASIHGSIDTDGFLQMMPLTQKAGHVGSGSKGTLNTSFLGFELCEPSGLTYNSNGSAIISYNPPAGFFEAVKNNAIELCAYLCQEYNIDPLQKTAAGGIVSHYEAHALGCGDNHADIRHWWETWESYTMDDFRQDVYNFMKDGEAQVPETVYNTIGEVPDWGRDTVQKLIDKGYLLGGGDGLDLTITMLRLLVINDRAGLYDLSK